MGCRWPRRCWSRVMIKENYNTYQLSSSNAFLSQNHEITIKTVWTRDNFSEGFRTFKEKVTQFTIQFCSSNPTAGPRVVAPGCCDVCRSHVTRQTPSHSLLTVFRGHLDTTLWPNTAQCSCATKKNNNKHFALFLRRRLPAGRGANKHKGDQRITLKEQHATWWGQTPNKCGKVCHEQLVSAFGCTDRIQASIDFKMDRRKCCHLFWTSVCFVESVSRLCSASVSKPTFDVRCIIVHILNHQIH